VIADYLIVFSEILSELRLDFCDPVTNLPMVLDVVLFGKKRPNSYQKVVAQNRVVAMVSQVPNQHVGGGFLTQIKMLTKTRKWRCRVLGWIVAGASNVEQGLVLMFHAPDIHPETAFK
jgi:hypothetical protein